MTRIVIACLFLHFFLLPRTGIAQDIPVDLHTGTPGISIPLWTITDHDLSQTIGLYYNATGLKLEQAPEHVGLGWAIFGPGKVTREVRGLPDDFDGVREANVHGVNYDNRRGWIRAVSGSSNPPAKLVGDFLPSGDLSGGTCSDETADFNTVVDFTDYQDSEPDIFHFSCGGLSGSFVFDNSPTPQIRLIPYQDVKVDYVLNDLNKDIIAFTITNNRGTSFHFNRPVVEQHSTTPASEENGWQSEFYRRHAWLNAYKVKELDPVRDYFGHVTYNTQWMLTRITSGTGAEISFEYSQHDFEVQDTLKVGVRKQSVNEAASVAAHITYYKFEEQRLNTVRSSAGQYVRLLYAGSDSLLTTIQVIDERRSVNPLVKEFHFTHRKIHERSFLESIEEKSGGSSMPPYRFVYTGVNYVNNTTALPSHHSTAKDLWGYYNGKVSNASLYPTLYVYPALPYPDKVRVNPIPGYSGQEITIPGATRNPDPVLMEIGALKSITYPMGGTLFIDYEANTYYDATADQSWMGGGLRVLALTHFDGSHPGAMIQKEFYYEETPGKSSGRLLAPPVFYMPTSAYISVENNVLANETYTELLAGPAEVLWSKLLVRTEDNIADESVVRYKQVTVKRPGSGSTKVLFDLPATVGEAASGHWTATVNRFARNNIECDPVGILGEGGTWRFPFAYNPNFDHERGLPVRSYDYNESGTLVRETETMYQYLYKQGNEPFKVWGLSIEKFPHASTYTFGKYFLLTDVVKVPATETVKTYDETNTAKFVTSTVQYSYAGTGHKLLSEIQTTNSDGTVHKKKIRYPLDFGVIPATSDKAAAMISKLQTDFFNGIPIETYATFQRPGENERVVGASLTKFNDFGTTTALAEYSLALKTFPLSDFTPASIQLDNGQYILDPDARYEAVTRIVDYGSGYLVPRAVENVLTTDVAGTIFGHNGSVPVAEVKFALPDEVAFSDFETASESSFNESSPAYGAGRTGVKGIHPSATLEKTLGKGNGSNYKLSFWLKHTGPAIDFALTLKNQQGTSTYYTTNFSATNNSGNFERVEKLIPVTSVPSGSTFQVILSSNVAAGTYTTTMLDDVGFYPEDAELTTYTYHIPYGISSVTDYTGVTSFQEYDALGRVKLSRDKDRNILARNTYTFSSQPDVLTGQFYFFDDAVGSSHPVNSGYVTVSTPIRFVAAEDSHDNVTYEWDFGSGFTTGSNHTEHTFAPGTYVVQLRVSKAGYTTQTYQRIIKTISIFGICAEGLKSYNPSTGVTSTSFPDCSAIVSTTPTYATTFKIDDALLVPLGEIRWRIRDIGSQVWTTLAGDVNQVLVENIDQRGTGFEVICEVWEGALKANSNVINVQFEY